MQASFIHSFSHLQESIIHRLELSWLTVKFAVYSASGKYAHINVTVETGLRDDLCDVSSGDAAITSVAELN